MRFAPGHFSRGAVVRSLPDWGVFRLLPLVLSACLGGVASAAEYTWSVEMPGVVSSESKSAPRAYLWLPAKTERVKGLVARSPLRFLPLVRHWGPDLFVVCRRKGLNQSTEPGMN